MSSGENLLVRSQFFGKRRMWERCAPLAVARRARGRDVHFIFNNSVRRSRWSLLGVDSRESHGRMSQNRAVNHPGNATGPRRATHRDGKQTKKQNQYSNHDRAHRSQLGPLTDYGTAHTRHGGYRVLGYQRRIPAARPAVRPAAAHDRTSRAARVPADGRRRRPAAPRTHT